MIGEGEGEEGKREKEPAVIHLKFGHECSIRPEEDQVEHQNAGRFSTVHLEKFGNPEKHCNCF